MPSDAQIMIPSNGQEVPVLEPALEGFVLGGEGEIAPARLKILTEAVGAAVIEVILASEVSEGSMLAMEVVALVEEILEETAPAAEVITRVKRLGTAIESVAGSVLAG